MDVAPYNDPIFYPRIIYRLKQLIKQPQPSISGIFSLLRRLTLHPQFIQDLPRITLSTDVWSQREFFQKILHSPYFRAWLESLFQQEQTGLLMTWTRILCDRLQQDRIIGLAVHIHRRYFAQVSNIGYKNALLKYDCDMVVLMLFWGFNPNSPLPWNGAYSLTPVEAAIFIGSYETLEAGMLHNQLLRWFLVWDKKQHSIEAPGVAKLSRHFGSLFHFAVSVNNIEALRLLLDSGIPLGSENHHGHTFLDILIDHPGGHHFYREVYNFLHSFRTEQQKQALHTLWQHADRSGVSTYQRLVLRLQKSKVLGTPDEQQFYQMLYDYWDSTSKFIYQKQVFEQVIAQQNSCGAQDSRHSEIPASPVVFSQLQSSASPPMISSSADRSQAHSLLQCSQNIHASPRPTVRKSSI